MGEVAKAIRLIGEKGIPGRIYGSGSGQFRPLRSYVEEIRDNIDPKLPLGIGERQTLSQQTFSSCVNIHDLTEDTGFVPMVQFSEGIKMTIKFFRGGYKHYQRIVFLYTSVMLRAKEVGA